MTTGYNRAQLDAMEEVLDTDSPPLPSPYDKKLAAEVTAMRAAVTDVGVLVNLGCKGGKTLLVMLNCVVARALVTPLVTTSLSEKWHQRNLMTAPSDHLQDPLPEHLATAKQVTGLSTCKLTDGVLVSFYLPDEASGGEIVMLFLPVRATLELAVVLAGAGDAAGWWTPELELIPSRESQN